MIGMTGRRGEVGSTPSTTALTSQKRRGCPCRKPKTGLIEKAVRDFDVDLGRSWVVGDSQADADLAKTPG